MSGNNEAYENGFASPHSPLFTAEEEGDVCCNLCPNNCRIKSGYFGACGVRGNKGGRGIIPFYGYITALADDPIEKKPLYHFKPGSRILSLGFAGCNFHCPFCQNWHISQLTQRQLTQRQLTQRQLKQCSQLTQRQLTQDFLNTDFSNRYVPSGRWMKPEDIISAALRQDTPSIAYTYSEPLIHIEYVLDCMALARKHGIANVLVTNGCINSEAAAEVLKLTDAANVDLKTFSAETYKKVLSFSGGDILQAVLDFIRLGCKMGIHIEITTLVVPDLNDSEEELNKAADFVASLKNIGNQGDIPWHLTAYHPDYRWNAPATDRDFLLKMAKEAGKKLRFVHTGNI